MDPVTALAAAELKRRLWRILRRVLAVVLPVVLIGALAMGVFTSALFAGDSSEGQENASFGCGIVARPAAVDIGSLDAEQLANAQTIVAVGRALGVPSKGWVIALSTALQESTLRNLPYGDRDSIGLFQQRDAWGVGRSGLILRRLPRCSSPAAEAGSGACWPSPTTSTCP